MYSFLVPIDVFAVSPHSDDINGRDYINKERLYKSSCKDPCNLLICKVHDLYVKTQIQIEENPML